MLHHAFDLKLAVGTGIAILAAATDATVPLNQWEDIGLKSILIGSLVFIGRLYLAQAREHKAEIKETWATHKSEAERREEKVVACMTAQSATLGKLCELTEEQTAHYRSFVKAAVDAKLANHGAEH